MQYKKNTEGLLTVWDVREVFKKLGISKAQSKVVIRKKDTHIAYFFATLELSETLRKTLISELTKLKIMNIQSIKLPEYCEHFLLKFESPLYIPNEIKK